MINHRSLAGGMTAALAMLVLIGAWVAPAEARPPRLFPIQGVLTDADGVPLEGPTRLRFALYDELAAATPLWVEERADGDEVVLEGGYFTVYLGEIQALDPAVLGPARELWLGLTVADDPEELPRMQLVSVPYALLAEDVRGDIAPRSVSVGGNVVIDAEGRWVGPSAGLDRKSVV